MQNILFTPLNEAEKGFLILPKYCNCTSCTATKNKLKLEVGEKRYQEITTELGIAA